MFHDSLYIGHWRSGWTFSTTCCRPSTVVSAFDEGSANGTHRISPVEMGQIPRPASKMWVVRMVEKKFVKGWVSSHIQNVGRGKVASNGDS